VLYLPHFLRRAERLEQRTDWAFELKLMTSRGVVEK
jgi:hypothetical protein